MRPLFGPGCSAGPCTQFCFTMLHACRRLKLWQSAIRYPCFMDCGCGFDQKKVQYSWLVIVNNKRRIQCIQYNTWITNAYPGTGTRPTLSVSFYLLIDCFNHVFTLCRKDACHCIIFYSILSVCFLSVVVQLHNYVHDLYYCSIVVR